MRRREALRVLLMLGLAAPFGSRAQEKMRRIGYLVMSPLADTPSPERAAFIGALRGLGYVEGRNFKIEYRSAEMEADFLPDLVGELVKSGVELIFVVESGVVVAAQKYAPNLPIVFVSVQDPVEMGFARSLARPGRNLTGITLFGVNLGPKRMELLRSLLPHARRIAVLRGGATKGRVAEAAALKPAADKLGFQLEPFLVGSADEFPRQLKKIAAAKPDALIVLTDSRTIAARRIIADFALNARLPSMMGFSGYAEAGGLISLASNFTEQFGRAATYVDRILKGAAPGDLPIEQPTTFELVINQKTASTLGIAIPQSLLLSAHRVIQ